MIKPLFTGTLAPRSCIRIYGAKPTAPTHRLVIVARPAGALVLKTEHEEQETCLRLANDNDIGASYAIFSLPKRVVEAGIPLGVLDFVADTAKADILIPQ